MNGEISIEKAYKSSLLSPENGRTSAFDAEPDVAYEPDIGRTSAFDAEPDVVGEQDPGRTSAFDPESDVVDEQDTGRTSAFDAEPDVVGEQNARSAQDPKNYQDSIFFLQSMPICPGSACAILDGKEIKNGAIDHIEIYENAMILSVMVENLHRPFPVSMIGTRIFVGSDCFSQAKKVS